MNMHVKGNVQCTIILLLLANCHLHLVKSRLHKCIREKDQSRRTILGKVTGPFPPTFIAK
jgi:uncharacterized membrane protein